MRPTRHVQGKIKYLKEKHIPAGHNTGTLAFGQNHPDAQATGANALSPAVGQLLPAGHVRQEVLARGAYVPIEQSVGALAPDKQ